MKESRIVEISEDARLIGVERGFLTIKNDGTELGRIELDSICAIICNSNWSIITTPAIAKIAEYNIPLVVCDKVSKVPTSTVLPLCGNYKQSHILQAQADASLPLRKNIWRQLVKAKLLQQSNVLSYFCKIDAAQKLKSLSENVKAGDSENCEAQGAIIYWKALMGDSFVRNRDAEDENLLLNYAYTVIRACVLRAICSAGLHPSLGVHHCSCVNTFPLSDDLIEPFRALADIEVVSIKEQGDVRLTIQNKRQLSKVIDKLFFVGGRKTSIAQLSSNLAVSLAQMYCKERNDLALEVIKTKYLNEWIF